ncbi:maltokinase N-terminal cap-like domain-containing protein [Nocardioides aurantiacus]|uniref:maltokinase N-terminal cap-like domain-containing protein n=1 Tax=Nocardioides aurantiacus TaxID=86796 RepID=UPI00403F5411
MTTAPPSPGEHPQMTAYLAQARWFAGKGRDHVVTDVTRVATLPGPPVVTIDVLTVGYPDGTTERYQMPLVHHREEQHRIGHALVGHGTDDLDPDAGERWTYDALHDREAMAVYLQTFCSTPSGGEQAYGGATFHRIGDHELATDVHSTLFSGEQSNSSVAFGDDSLLKVFRKVTSGRNPDIEIHRVLTEAENPNVAALYGWVQAGEDDLAMLQQFLRTAADGWDLALSSVRNLFSEADLHADEVGGDFAGESARLGAAVADVHVVLREHFGHDTVEGASLAAQMQVRLEAQLAGTPPLAPHADALRRVFDDLGDLGRQEVHRVHGDLHLGQTLRTARGWKLVDFEGEPAKPLDERRLPDSPWRDVAGMLRSFDYAVESVVKDLHELGDPGPQVEYRAQEWRTRNRDAFLRGYVDRRVEAGGSPMTDAEHALVDAYEADKAVYEVGYEARNRPTWVDIPLAAIQRIGDHA